MRYSLFLSCLATALTVASCPVADPAPTPGKYWYETITHNGINVDVTNPKYVVYRNVKDYGAKGDGSTDDSAAIQKAINTVDGSSNSTRGGGFSLTGAPAVVYFPAGTYILSSRLKNIMGTVLMGDPTNRPVLKASINFQDAVLLSGQADGSIGWVAFFYEIKNLVLDSTALAPTKPITLLQFDVSQACQVQNVLFNMPVGAAGHTGIETAGQVMPLLMNDISVVGGGVGYSATALQIQLKNWDFKNVKTGINVTDTLTQATVQRMRFEGCAVGIDASSGGSGHLSVLDSSAADTPTFLLAAATKTMQGSLVLENIIVDNSTLATVKIGTTTAALTGSILPGTTWIRGNVYSGTASAASPSLSSQGTKYTTSRPASLVNSTTGAYYTVTPPTYASYPLARIVNVKSVPHLPVHGDGTTDDTANLQSIIDSAAENDQLLFFPHGTYILTDTLHIPPNSRLVGEAWSRFYPRGSRFANATAPRPMVQVGKPGDIGVAQMTDFLFYTGANNEALPGLVMVEVNMAGEKPGDVGFFNTHFLVAGGSARVCAHLRETASAYWENSWATGQGAGGTAAPGAAGGFLVEARGGTWLVGIGSEHHVLYQLNIHGAKDVFLGLHQGETPYWQGQNNTLLPPAPFADSLLPGEPDFSWCRAADAKCRMALYQYVSNSAGVSLYGGAFWNFRAGPSESLCTGDCQTNAVLYENNEKLHVYGVGTVNDVNMVLETGPGGNVKKVVATRNANLGLPLAGDTIEVPAFVAAYLRQDS